MTSKHQGEDHQPSPDSDFARQVRAQVRVRCDQQTGVIEAELQRARQRMSLLGRLALGLHAPASSRAKGGTPDDH
ncbi:MAG: hypothetical protein R3175_17045 [Marinobacter sp.]|uniref:hypothetical protein n=1 Tax=Marinobacter sp. TaxID=50741 RepID=UPI00299E6B8F|nr:hypothetical protein [Marinobacter sp.]MDX1757766.1 hypothetical protein [Marinobacter sp.]